MINMPILSPMVTVAGLLKHSYSLAPKINETYTPEKITDYQAPFSSPFSAVFISQ
jgi:hypothetical protein